MSLEKFQLNPFLIRELYKDSLVAMDDYELSSLPTNQPGVPYLGENKKHILLMVNHAGIPYLTDDDLAFTTKWLIAINLTIADVAILNISGTRNSISELKKNLSPKMVFLFDTDQETIGLPLRFPNYQVQKFDGITFLSAPALKLISENNSEKKQFWNCLKEMFK